MSSDREPASYEPNYLSPDYSQPQEGVAPPVGSPATGPDFASVYDAPTGSGPSVYDGGYATPAPSPVVDQGQVEVPPPAPQPAAPQYGQPPSYGYNYGAQTPTPPAYAPLQPYQYGYQPAQADHPSTGAIFGLGIASLFVWVTAPIAWYMGSKARKDIAKGAPYRFPGLATAGWVIGIIYSVLMILFVLLLGFLVAMTTVSP